MPSIPDILNSICPVANNMARDPDW